MFTQQLPRLPSPDPRHSVSPTPSRSALRSAGHVKISTASRMTVSPNQAVQPSNHCLQHKHEKASCPVCTRHHIPRTAAHICHPVCRVGSCDSLRFLDLEEYEHHAEMKHPVEIAYPTEGEAAFRMECPQCGAYFHDFERFSNHVDEQCTKALQMFYDRTIVVKD